MLAFRLRPGRAGHNELQYGLTGRRPLSGARLQCRQLSLIMGRAEVFDRACPSREDHTICTAVAPDAVLMVRTEATAAAIRATI